MRTLKRHLSEHCALRLRSMIIVFSSLSDPHKHKFILSFSNDETTVGAVLAIVLCRETSSKCASA